MKAHGSREFARHFQSDSHWFKDVTYRVHTGMPVLTRLMEPMELTEEQIADHRADSFVELSEGIFSGRVTSKIFPDGFEVALHDSRGLFM